MMKVLMCTSSNIKNNAQTPHVSANNTTNSNSKYSPHKKNPNFNTRSSTIFTHNSSKPINGQLMTKPTSSTNTSNFWSNLTKYPKQCGLFPKWILALWVILTNVWTIGWELRFRNGWLRKNILIWIGLSWRRFVFMICRLDMWLRKLGRFCSRKFSFGGNCARKILSLNSYRYWE